MESIKSLLAVYSGVLLINVVLSATLWARQRTNLHRALFFLWSSTIVSFVAQGALSQGSLTITLGFSATFLVNVSLVHLLSGLVDAPVRWRRYTIPFGAGLLAALATATAAQPFWAISLPVALAVAWPLLDFGWKTLKRVKGAYGTTSRALVITCFAFAGHNLDFCFLRDKPSLAPFGFTVALLLVFALSVTATAVVLEKSAQDRLRAEEVNEFQRKFFANITHELRTPLTMIIAPLESLLAQDFGPLTPTQRAYLEANHRNAIRLLKLINDLLDLAKKEEGFLRLRPERTDLRKLLDEVVLYAKPLAARKNLSLQLEVHGVPKDLQVDLEKMERVLVNLLSNALKFTSEGGVTISLDCKDEWVELAVSDTGIGIAPEVKQKIFERFTQGDGSVTRRFGGTGIGLAYAKEIVDLHGGQIVVDSTPGKGSRFVVRLREGAQHISEAVLERRVAPAADSSAQLRRDDDREPREWAQHLQRKDDYRFGELGDATERRVVDRGAVQPLAVRVLVVEDHAEILELINLQLKDRYKVYVAQNGRAGLELAQRERPDLIISDYMMPEMDGLTMIRQLRADPSFQETSIIMLTAKNQLEDRLAVREAGVDIFLGKPFSPRELDAAVRQLLERRGRHVNNLMRAHAEGLEIVSGGLAHEIQNPLNFIKGAQHMISEHIGKIRDQVAGAALTDQTRVAAINHSREKIDRLVKSAAEGISRIEGVVAMVRRYAREGFPKEPTDVIFDEAVKEVAQLVAPSVEAECQLELDLQAGDARLSVIPEELNQVVRSLVQNAVEAAPRGGMVGVRTRAAGSDLILEVSDNGPGIAPEDITKIFSPFFTTKSGVGRGLGLSTAQLAVSRAGGTIDVSSVPGTNTTFRVRLPTAATAAGLALAGDSGRTSGDSSARPVN